MLRSRLAIMLLTGLIAIPAAAGAKTVTAHAVSPYVKPKYTDSTATSFAGVLAYAERSFRLPPLGPNDARAYGYKNAFDYTQRPIPPVPMVNRPVPRGAHTDWAQLRQDT
jgi:hypothetical protein